MSSSTFNLSNARAFAIADAQHVLVATDHYWPALEKFGATAADKKSLVDRLARAIVLHDSEPEGDQTLSELRPELDDLFGAYRASASLVAVNARAIDKVALRLLKAGGKFPGNDVALARYWVDLPKAIKKYSVALAVRGFSKDDQARMFDRMAVFERLMKARSNGKSVRHKASTERDDVFADLRWVTQYFRRLGRAALRTSPERTRFDRVSDPPRKVKRAEPPPVAAGAAEVAHAAVPAEANGKAKGALERVAQN